MERQHNNPVSWFLLDDLIRSLHRFKRYEIGHGDNQRLFKQFVNDLFMDARIVKEIEEMQALLKEIDNDDTAGSN